MGVYFNKKRNKFIARATINGKREYLGQADTRAEADWLVLQSKSYASLKTELFNLPELVTVFDHPSMFSRVKSFFTKGL